MSSETPTYVQPIGQIKAAAAITMRFPFPVLAAVLLALAASGCSARIDIERVNRTTATATEIHTAENNRTRAELAIQSSSPQPPQPRRSVSEERPANMCINNVTINYRGGDIHYHSDTHIHLHETPSVTQCIVIRPEPRRLVDSRCEQLRREHEHRIAEWQLFPLGK